VVVDEITPPAFDLLQADQLLLLKAKRKDEEAQLSVDPKRRKTMDLYTKEREGKLNASCQSRSPMPSTVPSPPPRHGGRRGRWGQARLVGAGEANGGRKPPAICPSPPAPNTRKPPGQIPSQQLRPTDRDVIDTYAVKSEWKMSVSSIRWMQQVSLFLVRRSNLGLENGGHACTYS
jgi:hypothetical protein